MNTTIEELVARVRPSRKDLNYVPVDKMQPALIRNVRKKLLDLEDLVITIIESPDKIPPLRGHKKDGITYITDGHRRREAGMVAQAKIREAKANPEAELYGLTREQILALPDEVTLLISPEPIGYTDVERLTDMFLLNEGKRLTIMEQCEGIKRLIDEFSLTPKQVARRLHKSITYINNSLRLLDAPSELQEHLNDGIVKPTLVRELMKEMSIEEVSRVINDTIDSKASQPRQLVLAPESGEYTNPSGNEAVDVHVTQVRQFIDDDEEIIIADDQHTEDTRNADGAQIKSLPVKITRLDVNEQLEKYNSLSAFRYLIRRYPDMVFNARPEMADEMRFFQDILEGNVNVHTLWNRYFDISSFDEKELERQLKS